MRLILLRHGRTATNAAGALQGRVDTELDAHGRAQAEAAAESVGAVDVVLTSPLTRARQTADAVVRRQTRVVEPEVCPELIELDYGEWDERPLADLGPDVWATWRADPDFAAPGGESLVQLHCRVTSLLDRLAADMPAERIALVSHVSPIKSAVCWAMGIGIEHSWNMHLSTASITEVTVGGGRRSLHKFNNEPS